MTKSVLIIGGNGYTGSRIIHDLNTTFNMESVDLCWFGKNLGYNQEVDYRTLTKEFLSKFDCVVLLAGHSSVKMCIGDLGSSWSNNITNFIDLVKKLDKDQLLIYASSSSVYGITSVPLAEDEVLNFKPIENYDYTKHLLDLNARHLISQGYHLVGLRFGTVNGWSPNTREELMINSMTKHSLEENSIIVCNTHIKRPILGLADLSRAIKTIIDCPTFGIYNLASFCDSVGNISRTVSDVMHSKIIRGVDSPAYDFQMLTNKFQNDFNFTFSESAKSIIAEIIANVDNITFSNRNQYKHYE